MFFIGIFLGFVIGVAVGMMLRPNNLSDDVQFLNKFIFDGYFECPKDIKKYENIKKRHGL